MTYRSFTLMWMVCALGLTGLACESGLKKFELAGLVNYNGAPIADGEIAFTPTKETAGPPTSAPIKDGKYLVTGRFGIAAGTYSVAIRAYRPKAVDPQDKAPKLAGAMDARDQYLPEKFNSKSEIPQLTIETDSGPVEHDFDLKD